jgi:hypothetical protein
MELAVSNEPHRVDASQSYTLGRKHVEFLESSILWKRVDKAMKLNIYECYGLSPETLKIEECLSESLDLWTLSIVRYSR